MWNACGTRYSRAKNAESPLNSLLAKCNQKAYFLFFVFSSFFPRISMSKSQNKNCQTDHPFGVSPVYFQLYIIDTKR